MKKPAIKNWLSQARLFKGKKAKSAKVKTKTLDVVNDQEYLVKVDDMESSRSNRTIPEVEVYRKTAVALDKIPGTPVTFVLLED